MKQSTYAKRISARVLKGHRILGALQILVGCLEFILYICIYSVIKYDQPYRVIASGLWAGGFFIAAGVSGVFVGRGVRSCTLSCVITCLILSITAACLGLILIITEVLFVEENKTMHNEVRCELSSFSAYYALSLTSILFYFIEFVIAIVHSTFACYATCCCLKRESPGAGVIVESRQPDALPPPPQQQQQPQDTTQFELLIVSPNGDLIPVPQQDIMISAGGQMMLPHLNTPDVPSPVPSAPILYANPPQPPFNPHFAAAMAQPPPYTAREDWNDGRGGLPTGESKTPF